MGDKILRCFCVLIILSLSVAQVIPKNVRKNGKRNVADPVAGFFSDLGDLFLDIDRSISVQTAPKVASQENIISQLLRPSANYFSKVQENYKTLQNEIGNIVRDSVGPKSVYRDRDLTTVGPLIILEEESFTDASGQTVKKEESNAGRKEPRNPFEKRADSEKEPRNPFEKRADSETDNECSEGTKDTLTDSGKQKCSRLQLARRQQVRESIARKIEEIQRINELFRSGTEEILKTGNVFSKRDGEASESDPKSDSSLLGDILYSESSFDKYIRQLLRDHGNWVLDNPLLSRWRQPENDAKNKDTQTEIPLKTFESSTAMDSEKSTQDSSFSKTGPTNRGSEPRELPTRSRSFYTVADDDDDGVIEEDIDIVLRPLPDSKIKNTIRSADRLKVKAEAKETVILAFTPNGVPLKLRMGPEIKNPVRFLNTVLKSAGVSLNVPVESYDDIEPVGKEVMKYGAGVLTRAVYLDLSKEDELKSLLTTLMKLKSSSK